MLVILTSSRCHVMVDREDDVIYCQKVNKNLTRVCIPRRNDKGRAFAKWRLAISGFQDNCLPGLLAGWLAGPWLSEPRQRVIDVAVFVAACIIFAQTFTSIAFLFS